LRLDQNTSPGRTYEATCGQYYKLNNFPLFFWVRVLETQFDTSVFSAELMSGYADLM